MGFNGEHEHNTAALHAQRIEHTAQHLRVPTILRSEPSVQEYLHAHNLFSDMQQTLAAATTRLAIIEPDTPYTPPAQWRGPDGTLQQHVPKPPRLIAPSVQEALRRNYQDAGQLLYVATALTKEGLLVRAPSQLVLKAKLNPVLDRYGLAIAEGRAQDNRDGKGWQRGRSLAYHATEAYKKALRKRQVWVEPLFGEAKAWHGLDHFRLRRLEKVTTEALLIATGQNLKRLLSWRGWPGGAAGVVLPAHFWSHSTVPT